MMRYERRRRCTVGSEYLATLLLLLAINSVSSQGRLFMCVPCRRPDTVSVSPTPFSAGLAACLLDLVIVRLQARHVPLPSGSTCTPGIWTWTAGEWSYRQQAHQASPLPAWLIAPSSLSLRRLRKFTLTCMYLDSYS